MKKLQTALLAAVFGATSVAGVLVTAATHPGLSAVALADDEHGDHDNRGKHRGWYKHNGCGYTNNRHGDDDEQGDEDDRRYNNGGYNNGYNNGQYPNNQYGQNGNCYNNGRNYGGGQYGNSSIRGTIVGVSGNTVTLLSNFQTITINDQPALDNQMSGRVAIGRSLTAYGYWQGGTFFATRMV